MTESNSMKNIIGLGMICNFILEPKRKNPWDYKSAVINLREYLVACSLKNTLGQLQSIEVIVNGFGSLDMQISPDNCEKLHNQIKIIVKSIQDEAEFNTTIILNADSVTDQIRGLPDKVNLEDNQKAMFSDMVRCVETGLNRPAIVMAWNLCYDFIRTWICKSNDRKDEFNRILTSKNVTHSITKIDDFFEHSRTRNESFVLGVCNDSQESLKGFDENLHGKLKVLLNERNKYAHANFRNASTAKAITYIEDIYNIMTERPFGDMKKDAK